MNSPAQRSLPSSRIGVAAQSASPARRWHSSTVSRSWPSANASSSIATRSPTVRAIAKRPPSMPGVRSSRTTRPRAVRSSGCAVRGRHRGCSVVGVRIGAPCRYPEERETHATLPARDVVAGHRSVTTVDTPPRTYRHKAPHHANDPGSLHRWRGTRRSAIGQSTGNVNDETAATRPARGPGMNIWPGDPFPLGATWDGAGTNFSLFSENAEAVVLCLFDEDGTSRPSSSWAIRPRSSGMATSRASLPASATDTGCTGPTPRTRGTASTPTSC